MRAGDAWQGPWMEARRRRTGSPDRAPERVLAAQRILYATGHTEPAALERRPVIGDSKTAGQNVTSSSGLARRGGPPAEDGAGGRSPCSRSRAYVPTPRAVARRRHAS